MKVARIFRDVGGYYVCSDELGYLDARGQAYPTKASAQRAAKELGYTHCIGSGSYRPDGGDGRPRWTLFTEKDNVLLEVSLFHKAERKIKKMNVYI